MAIAVNGGHVSRALDFYDKESKYFIIGGSKPWSTEPNPELPKVTDFRLKDVIGLKKVDNTFLVVPDNEKGTITYRDQKWRVVPRSIETKLNFEVISGMSTISVESVAGMNIGNKLRIGRLYEGVIISIEGSNITLDTTAPEYISEGSIVEGGALVEGAKYIYVEGYLEYDRFPLATYRQIGLCTGVLPTNPSNSDILRSASYNPNNVDEYASLGVLEILDNRSPIPRDINMRELVSMIIEM